MMMHRLTGLGRRRRFAVLGASAAVAAAALVVLGLQLASSQARARDTLTSRFADRAGVVSALIQAEIASVSSTTSTSAYDVPGVDGRVLDRAIAQSQLSFAIVLDHAGTVIARSRTATATDLSTALTSTALRQVRAGAPVAASDVLPRAPGQGSVVDLAVPLRSASRILVVGLPTPLLNVFLGTYLQRIPTRAGGAYVLDSHGVVISGGSSLLSLAHLAVSPVAPATLAREHSGPYGAGRYFTSAAVPGSTWRVVLTTTQAVLYSSVNGSRKWLPWVIFIALGLMALGFLELLRRLLKSAGALSIANTELASSNAQLQSTNELLRHAAELSRSNAELEQFASIASHDLQEPLRKVQTFAAQLTANEAENLSPQGQDFLRRMSDAAGRMRALIDDLLIFSRVSTKGRAFTEVNLGDVIAQVLVDLEIGIAEAGAELIVGPMPTIEADPLQMRQLLQNLIGNALKFRRAGVSSEVRVSAHSEQHVAEITVADNGIGFDGQYATRIFRAFERLHGSRAYPGTGIGLALCRKIVERHHGTITATSRLDEGATFTVRLPLQQPAADHTSPPSFPEPIDHEVARVHA
jgi:signal transduction histidine kinase